MIQVQTLPMNYSICQRILNNYMICTNIERQNLPAQMHTRKNALTQTYVENKLERFSDTFAHLLSYFIKFVWANS